MYMYPHRNTASRQPTSQTRLCPKGAERRGGTVLQAQPRDGRSGRLNDLRIKCWMDISHYS